MPKNPTAAQRKASAENLKKARAARKKGKSKSKSGWAGQAAHDLQSQWNRNLKPGQKALWS